VPQFLMMGGVSLLFGRIVGWIGLPAALVSGYALAGSALCAMPGLDASSTRTHATLLLLLLGGGMGLAVPATGMAVMGHVAQERAGIASATMNALRQAGMSVGIALLGSVMSQRAVQHLTAAADAAGQPQVALQARLLVFEPAVASSSPHLLGYYRAAMASGFGWAMALAGAMGVLTAFALHRRYVAQ